MDNTSLLQTFYNAFAQRDYARMADCYHEEATFSDPVFPKLNAQDVRAMWQMLCQASTQLELSYTPPQIQGQTATLRWEARYPFGPNKRPVHNIIQASFEFKDGKIYRHIDHFNFYRWSKQALGLPGLLLGWTNFMQRKVQQTAMKSLRRFQTKPS